MICAGVRGKDTCKVIYTYFSKNIISLNLETSVECSDDLPKVIKLSDFQLKRPILALNYRLLTMNICIYFVW